MSKYYVDWWMQCRGVYEIEADSEEEAAKIAEDRVWNGDTENMNKVIDAEAYGDQIRMAQEDHNE